MTRNTMNTNLVHKALAYCAREVDRQQDSPMHVLYMFAAWEFAKGVVPGKNVDNEEVIHTLSMLVRGYDSVPRYRGTPVYFAQGGHAANHQSIGRLMSQLMDLADKITVDQYVHEFLRIHPYEDGNGRVASLLYNIGNGTVLDPVDLPHYEFT